MLKDLDVAEKGCKMITLIFFLKHELKLLLLYSYYDYLVVILSLLGQIYSRNIFSNQKKIYHCISIKTTLWNILLMDNFQNFPRWWFHFTWSIGFPFVVLVTEMPKFWFLDYFVSLFFQLPVKHNLFLWNQKSLSAKKRHPSNLVITLNF